MKTVKVPGIDSVTATLSKTNPPSLLIDANGHTNTGGYTNIRLEPIVYKKAPANGIWEFNMVADAPTGIVNNMVTQVAAEYNWKEYPPTVKGIKVYSASNNIITMLDNAKIKTPTGGQPGIQIIKAEAWVNTEPKQPTTGDTLVVNVTYNSNNPGFHSLHPLVPQGINPKILMLEITDSIEMIYIFNPRHSSYSVGLQAAGQYSSIELYYEGKKVGSINKIQAASFHLRSEGERVPFPLK
jgi:hypothetical protein